MQSILAITAAKLKRQLLSGGQRQFFWVQRLGYATNSGRTADPAEHAVDPEEVSPTEALQDEKRRHSPEHEPTTKDDDPFIPPKSPIQSEQKIGSTGVGPLTNPFSQQKRRSSSGDPWPEEENEIDLKRQREDQQGDNVEYYKHHKASPLSEIEIADTRKPITRATDGTVQNETVGNEGTGFIVWSPEQMDTAEDSLRRAAEIFRCNAARGDPDSPHGRVLRELRGEYW